MALTPGMRLGAYEVIGSLGAGGMGEVYRARDGRLDRDVAIKVLPADRLADPHRRQRFLQEAKSASALNHPHIITIHEIETDGDIDFIVMEYVRGRSLEIAIPRQGFRPGELLRIAIPVADALAAAHARGIVHRDLKPANVMIGDDGAVKVLDFGLAKLVQGQAASDDETTTRAHDGGLSAPGAIVGTPAFMAPEQATGAVVDARSDIFSFGAMLYEMATGARAFAGDSAAETVAAVLRVQPTPPSQIVPAVSRDLERVIMRCLRKEPDRRYQTILDVKIELLEIKEESDSGRDVAAAAPPARRRTAVSLAAIVGVLVVGAAWYFWLAPTAAVPPPRVIRLTSFQGVAVHPSFSPGGDQIAFSWTGDGTEPNEDIYVKLLDVAGVQRLTNDPAGDVFPRWSPDGKQIAFMRFPRGFADVSYAYVMYAVGGTERRIVDVPVGPVRWLSDSRRLLTSRISAPRAERGVYVVSIDGAAPRQLTRPEGTDAHMFPDVSPDGRQLAYASCDPLFNCSLVVVDVTAELTVSGQPRVLRSEPFFITELVWTRDGGSIVYSTEQVPFGFYLWRQAADGSAPAERIEMAGIGAIGAAPSLSHDRLAFGRVRSTVAVHVLGDESPRPLLASALWDHHPDFSPDGRRLAFSSSRSGEALEIWLASPEGRDARQLTHGPGVRQGSPAWSPQGDRIAFESNADGRWSIWTIGADGGAPTRLTSGPGQDTRPSWSRDGQWIYYSSAQTDGNNIRRAPAGGGEPQPVTSGGSGSYAVESADGSELLYKASDREGPLLAQPLAGGAPRQVIDCVRGIAFVVRNNGIYYAGCGTGRSRPLYVFDPRTRQRRELGTIVDVFRMINRFAVSPDEKTILVHRESFTADAMMIDPFR